MAQATKVTQTKPSQKTLDQTTLKSVSGGGGHSVGGGGGGRYSNNNG